jgi:hypothetical protein
MNYELRLAVVTVLGCAALAACAPNAKKTTATIMTIDRECKIVETSYDENYKKKDSRTYTDRCNSIDEWDKVRAKRTKDVAGTAVVHLSYTAPQTGQSETGELKFDGHDDEFYQLKAGDPIDILVSDADPTHIQKV